MRLGIYHEVTFLPNRKNWNPLEVNVSHLNSNWTLSLAPGLLWAALRQALYSESTFSWTLLCRMDMLLQLRHFAKQKFYKKEKDKVKRKLRTNVNK